MTAAHLSYRFNGFCVDPVRRLLFGPDGAPISLKPKVFDTLLYLIERRGELVGKQALLEGVWPHVVVEDNNLNKAISSLRQVFGETRDEHRFIVTEPGRGYRFVAMVEEVPPGTIEPPRAPTRLATLPEPYGAPAATPAHSPRDSRSKRLHAILPAAIAAACAIGAAGIYWIGASLPAAVDVAEPVPAPSSIAVLPFHNLSPDPDDAYFAVGLHEAILSQLTKIGGIHVIARASVQGYAGTHKPTPVIARELNVQAVLEGSVRYADGQVLVTMHLSDGASNTSLWSDSYEHDFSKIFTIQNDIALEVAKALKAELLPAERARVVRAPTTSLPAYTWYLQAVTRERRSTSDEILLAIGDIEYALELDQDFATAWVLDANLRTVASMIDPANAAEHRWRGEHAARRALKLDPELGTAHVALGFVLAMKKDWTGAEAAYREALRRNVPLGEMSAYAMLKTSVANFADARDALEQEVRLNPQNRTAGWGLIGVNALLGDWDAARAQYAAGTRLFAPWPEGDMVMMHFEVGHNELERAHAIPAVGPINAAMIATLDDPQTALRELHRLYEDPSVAEPALNHRDIALWAGHFGDAQFALDAMRSLVAAHSAQAVYLWLPQLEQMRQLPEFGALLREMGIVAHWQEYGWPEICRPLDGESLHCD